MTYVGKAKCALELFRMHLRGHHALILTSHHIRASAEAS